MKMPAAAPTAEFTDLTRAELERALADLDVERYRARQLYQWVYGRGVDAFDSMTDLSIDLRQRLTAHFRITTPAIVSRDISTDGTQKFLFALGDGTRVESVFIPDTPSQTFCVSTQAGCAMGCAFCLTATMGLVRNLTPGEIVGQVRVLAREVDLAGKPFNIVMMGMGEPLHNYDHTMASLAILCDRHGLAVPARRITLSTVGLVPAIERLANEAIVPNLAVSLHAASEDLRARLVPIAKKYSITEIINACRHFPLKHRDRITFEYVLLAGVNDSPAEARKLAKVLRGVKAKVNLIPLNPAAGIPFERPSDNTINEFAAILAEHRVTVLVRKSRGRDIRAACGQLAVEGRKKTAAQRLADAISS